MFNHPKNSSTSAVSIKEYKSRVSAASSQNKRDTNEDKFAFSTIELPEVLSDQQWTRVLTEAVAKLAFELRKRFSGSTLCSVIAHADVLRIVNVGDSGAQLVIIDKASGLSVPITIKNGQIEYDASSKNHGLLLHKIHKPEISTEDLKKKLNCNSSSILAILGAIAQSGIEEQYLETCAVIKGGGSVTSVEEKGVRGLRLNNDLAMSRALGDLSVFNAFHNKEKSIFYQPDVITLRFNWKTFPKDAKQYTAYTIVATDGYTDVFTPNETADKISKYDKQDIASNLIDEAIQRGSEDNTTVIVLTSGNLEDAQYYGKVQMVIVADGHRGESTAEHIIKNFFKHVINFLNGMRFTNQLSQLIQEDLKYMSDAAAVELNSMLTIIAESKTEKEKIDDLWAAFCKWNSKLKKDYPILFPALNDRYLTIFAMLNEVQCWNSKFDGVIFQMQQLIKVSSIFYTRLKQKCAGFFFKENDKEKDREIALLKLEIENLKASHNENKDDKRNLNHFKFRPPISTAGVSTDSSTDRLRRYTI